MLRAGCVQLAPLALGAQTGDVARQVQDGALAGQHWRGVGRRAGHVQAAHLLLLVAAMAGEVAQGDELGCAGSGHVVVLAMGGWRKLMVVVELVTIAVGRRVAVVAIEEPST